jgi:Arc-like DNA binding domain
MTKKTTQLVHVRMPKDLHRKIQREADRKGQTINAEILMRLAQAFDAAKALDVAENALTEVGRSVAGFKTELENRQKALNVTPTLNEKLIDEMASRIASSFLPRMESYTERVLASFDKQIMNRRLENSFSASEHKELVDSVLRDERLLNEIGRNIWERWLRAEALNEPARAISRQIEQDIAQQQALEQKREADEQTALVRTQEEEIERAVEELAARMGLPPDKFLSITVLNRLGPPVSSRTSDEDDFARRKKTSGVFQTGSTKGKSDD